MCRILLSLIICPGQMIQKIVPEREVVPQIEQDLLSRQSKAGECLSCEAGASCFLGSFCLKKKTKHFINCDFCEFCWFSFSYNIEPFLWPHLSVGQHNSRNPLTEVKVKSTHWLVGIVILCWGWEQRKADFAVWQVHQLSTLATGWIWREQKCTHMQKQETFTLYLQLVERRLHPICWPSVAEVYCI